MGHAHDDMDDRSPVVSKDEGEILRRIRRRDYQATPDDPCISLYCFHAREYHAPNCVFSGCTCKAFEESPTEAEAEAILRQQGIDPKQLTNDFIEHLFKHIAKQAAELAASEQRISELTSERDDLGKAIAEAAHHAGIYNMQVPLTGPELIMLCDDMSEEVVRLRQTSAAARQANEWQPIESAEQFKDGRTLWFGYWNRSGKWRTVRGQWFTEGEIGEWENGEDFEAGWYETSEEQDEPPNCWPITPKYFMRPLPAPPVPLQ